MILNLKILVLCYVICFVAGAPSEQLQESQQQEDGMQQKMNDGVFEEKLDDYYRPLSYHSVYYEKRDLDPDVEEHGAEKHGIDANQQKDILDLHNELRRKEGASDMHKLHWNAKLAHLGQKWSERCVFEHGQPPHDAADVGYTNIGQNIYAHTSPTFNVKQAVQGWYDEKPDYHYDSLQCNPGKACGHYTAVTWADTKEVGCGMAFCPSMSGLKNAHYIVCNYGPPGNWAGEKPFHKGSECTKCSTGKFFCDKGLCDHTCKTEGPNCHCVVSCKNNGEKTKDCGCICKEGFMGVDCSEPCNDLHRLCGANPGYPAAFCTSPDPKWAFIKDKCPKMCGKCKARKDSEILTNSLRDFLSLLEDEIQEHKGDD